MAVERIEEYRMQNGDDILKIYCKPTKKFPEGKNYFYTDADAIDLVKSHIWYLVQQYKNIYVETMDSWRNHYKFHRELAYKYLGYYPDYLDHISSVEIDNIDKNLNIVTNQQNTYNRPTKGYKLVTSLNRSYIGFNSRIVYNQKHYAPYKTTHSEVEACILQHLVETDFLKLKMGDQYYMYDFLKDRRNDLDILDLERTGIISQDEATYHHVLKYADNAWYYYRYGLEDYFRQHHIPIPSYSLDSQGFMIHPITGQKLCPFS